MTVLIKDMPDTSKPREKALKQGLNALSDAELLAIIINNGHKDMSVLDLANTLLNDVGSLHAVSNMALTCLTKYHGIGLKKGLTILSAFELGKRAINTSNNDKIKVVNAKTIFNLYRYYFCNIYQEHLMAMYLDNKNNIINTETIFIGSINASLFHPREIFKKAIDHRAVKIILIHNHPSGDPTPSKADLEFTTLMIKNGLMLDIKVIDHVIIGNDMFYSFYDHNPELF